MMKAIQRVIIVAISMIMTGVGASMALKAAVGVGAWDALSQSISGVIDMKVGTFSMMMNISCVLIQLFLLKKEFKLKTLTQILVAILLGYVVNFMFYDVFARFTIHSYWANIVLLIVSCVICAGAVSMIMTINLITFPLESCCMVISKKINKNFGAIRQFVDILSIVVALGVSFFFNQCITVREGTVIMMLLFGPLLNVFMKMMIPRLKKVGLID
ncbi:YczE/YyaS/YitT family protein [Bacillus sp. JJ1764]|uniref:YczE/YyaS/YitT family protein n=1 Tax=Bacillus sp. JJ1764 TaxID=3122964 RepID=UPI003000190D